MPLDPQAQAALDRMAAAGLKPAHLVPVNVARRLMALMRPPGSQVEAVGRVEDRQIPGPGGDLPVRMYWPSGPGPFPILVYFHGGGWIRGNLDSHDGQCRSLTNQAGCLVVSVDYRLSPESRFPDAIEDAYAATRWAAAHGASLNGDPTRLAVGGDSAGGNLAAAVTLMARDRGGPPICFQLLIYPVTNYAFDTPSYRENAEGYVLTRDAMKYYWDLYLSSPADAGNPYASPLRATDFGGLPPALVITAQYDPLRDEGRAYAARLREAGVPVIDSCYEGVFHGFFGMAADLDKAKLAVAEAAAALRASFTQG
ncbi:MAG TPA: alpha/beta hydrolase [Dehalococcoidia bacterium]|nr:alpha/beta hydrolase [Dehalococcoidia bacterium]